MWFNIVAQAGYIPDSNVHGANMGPTWVLSASDGPHVGPHEPCYQGWVQYDMALHITQLQRVEH